MTKTTIFNFKEPVIDELFERSARMVKKEESFRLVGVNRSIQFLRGVFSRATFCLPAFYYFLGSESEREESKSGKEYSSVIARSYAEFSALNTLSLSCRKLFDHSVKIDLTGANFAKLSDAVITEHSEFWSSISKQPQAACLAGLLFLRKFFTECAKSNDSLLKANSPLQKRIGLIKQHADRAAAHLSLDDYALTFHDLAHFVGASVYIAEIIRMFDNPPSSKAYFNELDEASYDAAKHIFPNIAKIRLFAKIDVARQSRLHLEAGDIHGVTMILNDLHRSLLKPIQE